MSLIKFNPSKKPFTIGVELEVRLVDNRSYAIKNCSKKIFKHLPKKLNGFVHKELLESMVEIVTPICNNAFETTKFIKKTAKKIDKIGKKYNFKVVALATHPFETKDENKIFPNKRYKRFEKEFQIVIRNFLICGLHIHIGLDSEERVIRAYNTMVNYFPIFLALSANSPFFNGEDSGLASYRSKIFEQLPRASIFEYFNSYQEYEELCKQLQNAKMIESFKDIWWDIRIHPLFGTIELRVCDSFYDEERLKLLTLFYHSLILYSTKREPKREFLQIIKQNKWNATRYGLEGIFIEQNRVVTIREKAIELIEEMERENIFKILGYQHEVKNLKKLIFLNSISKMQKEVYKKTEDFKEVIKLGFI